VDPECGRLFFWLGKERYNAKWARGSEMWACFGGRPLHKSEPPESIAAREFVEETSGMLMYFPTDVLPRASHVDIAQSLTNQEFLFRIVFGVSSSSGHITPVSSSPASLSSRSAAIKSIYVMFVKQIHWDPHAARRFKACMNVMNKLPEVVKDVRRREWLLEHPAIHLKKPALTSVTDGKQLAAHVSISKHPCTPACRRMCYMQQQHYLEPQPEFEPDNTEHHHLMVDKDYVEKQEIALWSVPQMQRATRSNGVLTTRNGNVERCRSTFTKQIVAVLAELSFYEPSILDERV
jgi:hypothetical protein